MSDGSRRLACIVEGHGEVNALPVLIRRLHEADPSLLTPVLTRKDVLRIPRHRVVRPGELERAVELAARRTGSGGAVLMVLDADDDPACELGPALLSRAMTARSDVAIAVVLAVREFEAWFLAAARSLRGAIGLAETIEPPDDPEAIRDAKGWLSGQMAGDTGYREILHQAKLAARMDVDDALVAPSFQKFRRDVQRLLATDG